MPRHLRRGADGLPGITFGGTFRNWPRWPTSIAVVRSYGSRNGDHSYLSVTGGGNPLKASMSTLYARVAGADPSADRPAEQCAASAGSGAAGPEARQQLRDRRPADADRDRRSWPDLRRLRPGQRRRIQEDDAAAEWRRNASATVAPCSANSTPSAAGRRPRTGEHGPFPAAAFDLVTRGVAELSMFRRKTRSRWRSTTPASSSVWRKYEVVRHAAGDEPARQANAAGPPADRGRRRLRHRLRLRLGPSRQREQSEEHGRLATSAARSITPWPRSWKTSRNAA